MVYFVGDPAEIHHSKEDFFTKLSLVEKNIFFIERKLSNGGLSGDRKRCYLFQLEKLQKSRMKILAIIGEIS